MKTCLKCGANMADDAMFCKKCGFADVKKCPKCGKERMSGSMFCRACGTRFYTPEEELPDTESVRSPIAEPAPSVSPIEPVAPVESGAASLPEAALPMEAAPESISGTLAVTQPETGLESLTPDTGVGVMPPMPVTDPGETSEYHSFVDDNGYPVTSEYEEPVQADMQIKQKSPLLPIIVAASLVFIIGASVAVFFLVTANSRRYKQAKKDLEEGNYEQAVNLFEKIGKYEDAEDLLEEARAQLHYENGKKAFDSEDFDKAAEEFKAAGTINNAEYMAKQSEFAGHYKKGTSLSGSGDYEAAIDEFYKASDYKDAPTQVKACYYKLGEAELAKDNPDGAEKYFDLAEGYQDASSKISEINYKRGEMAYKAGDNLSAAKYFYKAGKYQDAEDRANELYYNLAIEAFNRGESDKAAEYFSLIGDYKDSKSYAQSVYYTSGKKCLEAKDYENAGKYLNLAGDYQNASTLLTNTVRDLVKGNDLINARKLCSFDPSGDKYIDGLIAFFKADYLTAADHFKSAGDMLNAVTCYKSSYYNYGLGIFKTKDYEEAEKYFKLGEDYSYASKMAHVCEGEIKYSQGYISQAANEYSNVKVDNNLKNICKARGFDVAGRKAFIKARLTLENIKGTWAAERNNIFVKHTDKYSGYSTTMPTYGSENLRDGQIINVSFTFNETKKTFNITIELSFVRYTNFSYSDYDLNHELKTYKTTLTNKTKLPSPIYFDNKAVVLKFDKGIAELTYNKNVTGSSGVNQFYSKVYYKKTT